MVKKVAFSVETVRGYIIPTYFNNIHTHNNSLDIGYNSRCIKYFFGISEEYYFDKKKIC